MSIRRTVIVAALLALTTTITPAASAAPAPAIAGMVVTPSTASFDATWDSIIATLEANPNIGIVAVVDHAAAAASVGLALAPTREVFFGNPALGTPLMQANQTAGIDLPQKIAVWETPEGDVFVGYNSTEYLQTRHDLGDVATLPTIAGALSAITGAAVGDGVRGRSGSVAPYETDPRLVVVASDADADTTFDRLLAAIDAAPPSVVFTLDHAANAAGAGFDLDPTKLVVFGSPVLGTPLMAEQQSIAIDLPLKFLVYTSGDSTYIAYNDVHALARRHGVTGQDALLDTIAGALAGLSQAGAGG